MKWNRLRLIPLRVLKEGTGNECDTEDWGLDYYRVIDVDIDWYTSSGYHDTVTEYQRLSG